jgi:formate C-acetyltransferase
LDRSRAFELGLDALRKSLDGQADATRGVKQETYQAFALAIEGLSTMIGHAAAAVAAAVPGASAARQAELELMAASCRRVAHAPPRTFLDALHLLWFIDMGTQLANDAWLVGPGHLDRTLYPFYRRDIDSGALTKEDALQLVEALYLLVNHTIPNGLAIPVMVGGRDAGGRDLTNELSCLCLEALRRTNLVYPTVGVCWHAGTPPELTSLAVELISKGYSTPALFGDETIQKGLRLYGVPAGESHSYINSTCVEITPVGASNVWVASPYFSTCQILLEEIDAQAAAGGPETRSFDGFMDAYLARLSGKIITDGVLPQNECRERRRQNGGKPLQSVFTRDCVARGLDIDEGGARYNWVECSFVGLANLADSLAVIRAEVFERRALDFQALKKALDGNFKDDEPLRLRFLNGHPKYGNADAGVDALVAAVVERVKQECARHRMAPDEAPVIPGAFCWIMHERLGKACGATPDGRKAGFPFADGGGPAQGREMNGPTSAILSATSWDPAPLIGGVAYNMKFNSALFDSPAAVKRLEELLVTYLRRGGFEVQVNVVDPETLRQARANPEPHRDLVVRIGGYTDYFVNLSAGMQDEVMMRTEFGRI